MEIPLLAKSVPHLGGGVGVQGAGFEANVVPSGSALTAYLYRELLPTDDEPYIRTDKIDISCIAADPDAPPVAVATMTNLSALTRPSPENTKNYHGDKWQLKDSTVSYAPLTNLEWDIRTGASGPFVPDPAWSGPPSQNPELSDINPAYWPCEPANGGNLSLGTACWQSLGAPQGGNFHLGLRATNTNGVSPVYFSPSVPVLAPAVNIVGWNGTLLQVLAGNPNNGNASASQGNTAEANFAWTFTCAPACGALNGPIVTIPVAATAFSLIADVQGRLPGHEGRPDPAGRPRAGRVRVAQPRAQVDARSRPRTSCRRPRRRRSTP